MERKQILNLVLDILIPIIIVICAIIFLIRGDFETALIALCLATVQAAVANILSQLSVLREEVQELRCLIIDSSKEAEEQAPLAKFPFNQ